MERGAGRGRRELAAAAGSQRDEGWRETRSLRTERREEAATVLLASECRQRDAIAVMESATVLHDSNRWRLHVTGARHSREQGPGVARENPDLPAARADPGVNNPPVGGALDAVTVKGALLAPTVAR